MKILPTYIYDLWSRQSHISALVDICALSFVENSFTWEDLRSAHNSKMDAWIGPC